MRNILISIMEASDAQIEMFEVIFKNMNVDATMHVGEEQEKEENPFDGLLDAVFAGSALSAVFGAMSKNTEKKTSASSQQPPSEEEEVAKVPEVPVMPEPEKQPEPVAQQQEPEEESSAIEEVTLITEEDIQAAAAEFDYPVQDVKGMLEAKGYKVLEEVINDIDISPSFRNFAAKRRAERN